MLGRVGWLLLNDGLEAEEIAFLAAFTRRVLDTYGNSVLAVSDEQAGPTLVFLAGCVRRRWIEEAEEVVGRLYHDVIANSARIARHFLSGADALQVLDHRYDLHAQFDSSLYHRPSDLVSVVVICAALLSLDEAVDSSLILIDHTPLNILAPERVLDLGTVGPIGGKNIGLNIGDGIWRCIDIRREWDGSVISLLTEADAHGPREQSAALISAMALRDRVPWFVAAKLCWSAAGETFTRVSFR